MSTLKKNKLKKFNCSQCGWSGYRKPDSKSNCPHCGQFAQHTMVKTLHSWTREEDQFIKQHYKKYLYPELAKMMGLTGDQVRNRVNKLKLRLPKKELARRKKLKQFIKGQLSWNKGLTLKNIPNSGQFTKGHNPKNTMSDGAITFRKRNRQNGNYYFIRIASMKWIPLHKYLWEKHHGPIPRGMLLRYKDGDHRNCTLKNLELISRAQHLSKNKPSEKRDLIYSNYYIASRLKIYGKEKQQEFIEKFPELIELKRNQLLLKRGINAARRKIAVNG